MSNTEKGKKVTEKRLEVQNKLKGDEYKVTNSMYNQARFNKIYTGLRSKLRKDAYLSSFLRDKDFDKFMNTVVAKETDGKGNLEVIGNYNQEIQEIFQLFVNHPFVTKESEDENILNKQSEYLSDIYKKSFMLKGGKDWLGKYLNDTQNYDSEISDEELQIYIKKFEEFVNDKLSEEVSYLGVDDCAMSVRVREHRVEKLIESGIFHIFEEGNSLGIVKKYINTENGKVLMLKSDRYCIFFTQKGLLHIDLYERRNKSVFRRDPEYLNKLSDKEVVELLVKKQIGNEYELGYILDYLVSKFSREIGAGNLISNISRNAGNDTSGYDEKRYSDAEEIAISLKNLADVLVLGYLGENE